jgi:hypothetical protein
MVAGLIIARQGFQPAYDFSPCLEGTVVPIESRATVELNGARDAKTSEQRFCPARFLMCEESGVSSPARPRESCDPATVLTALPALLWGYFHDELPP